LTLLAAIAADSAVARLVADYFAARAKFQMLASTLHILKDSLPDAAMYPARWNEWFQFNLPLDGSSLWPAAIAGLAVNADTVLPTE
jgi:hypothetical protein